MTKDPIFAFANHVVSTSLEDMPDEAIKAAKTFILDTLGVGISGAGGPMAAELVAAASKMGAGSRRHHLGKPGKKCQPATPRSAMPIRPIVRSLTVCTKARSPMS